MKSICLVTVVALTITSTAFAKAPDQCAKITDLAGEAMEARQGGDLLENVIKSVGDGSKFSEGMVIRAYEIRVYAKSEEKKSAISEFRNGAY